MHEQHAATRPKTTARRNTQLTIYGLELVLWRRSFGAKSGHRTAESGPRFSIPVPLFRTPGQSPAERLWNDRPVAVGSEERFNAIRSRVVTIFGADDATVERVARVIRLLELAWHDVYGELSPPDEVVDDVLMCSEGTIEGLVDSVSEAVTDWRDLRVAADAQRNRHRRRLP